MVELFTKQQFNDALPKNSKTGAPLFEYIGTSFGEHCWAWKLPPNRRLRMVIRSSISADGNVSASSGEDSIRIVMEREHSIKGWVGIQKRTAYTTRVPGWEKRLIEKIRSVIMVWHKVAQTFEDDDVIFVCKEGKNAGRVFSKNDLTGKFRWLS